MKQRYDDLCAQYGEPTRVWESENYLCILWTFPETRIRLLARDGSVIPLMLIENPRR